MHGIIHVVEGLTSNIVESFSKASDGGQSPAMANPDRLTGLDASFLALEDAGAHMHVGSCMLFEGEAPDYEDFVAQVDSRLHLVPRYRQKLAFPPLTQARPVWVDDPHFNPGYHVRHTALPEPASLEQLRNLTGRVLAQRLDRGKPLWELWLVQKVEGGRFAIVSKTHHCLVDGVSGVDIATVLFDLEESPAPPPEPPPAWFPRPEPTSATLIADALAEGVAVPLDAARAAAGALAHPERPPGSSARPSRASARCSWPGCRARPQPLQRADRAAPALRLGRRRPRPVQGDQVRARRHGQRHRAERGRGRAAQPHAGQRPRGRRHRAQGDGADVGARRGRARRARQPRDRDVRAAAGHARRPGRALRSRPRGDEGAQGVRPGRRRRGDHPARRLRAADGALPGLAPAVRASACSTSS